MANALNLNMHHILLMALLYANKDLFHVMSSAYSIHAKRRGEAGERNGLFNALYYFLVSYKVTEVWD